MIRACFFIYIFFFIAFSFVCVCVLFFCFFFFFFFSPLCTSRYVRWVSRWKMKLYEDKWREFKFVLKAGQDVKLALNVENRQIDCSRLPTRSCNKTGSWPTWPQGFPSWERRSGICCFHPFPSLFLSRYTNPHYTHWPCLADVWVDLFSGACTPL